MRNQQLNQTSLTGKISMELEQQIKEAGADKAPRITPDHINSKIKSEHYFTAAQGYEKSCADNFSDDPYPLATPDSLHLLTFCVLVLENGFTVTGESACASPENFNEEIGRKIAYENAIDKVWLLEGYLLKQNLHEQSQSQEMLKGFLQDDNCEGGGCKI